MTASQLAWCNGYSCRRDRFEICPWKIEDFRSRWCERRRYSLRVVVIIGKAIDLAIGNGEIFPLLGFDGQGIVVNIHVHTATEKRPAGECAEGDDEKNDERCALREQAWRDAAAGKWRR